MEDDSGSDIGQDQNTHRLTNTFATANANQGAAQSGDLTLKKRNRSHILAKTYQNMRLHLNLIHSTPALPSIANAALQVNIMTLSCCINNTLGLLLFPPLQPLAENNDILFGGEVRDHSRKNSIKLEGSQTIGKVGINERAPQGEGKNEIIGGVGIGIEWLDIDDSDYPIMPHVLSYIIETFIHSLFMINITRLLLWCIKLADTHNFRLLSDDNDNFNQSDSRLQDIIAAVLLIPIRIALARRVNLIGILSKRLLAHYLSDSTPIDHAIIEAKSTVSSIAN
ncbi:MAG: hypothetical protein EZS28_021264 [Streblomastix strix]|uniref:Uncharacterized protein n=1 Tax=Streblomastix strix TaxID=222440 RepID=A0A5J4VL44_9EUKA|nr:MAG: hypothetical protein EZS28_021264 [Streblomastix strix]